MGLKTRDSKKKSIREWKKVLEYINTKRTHEPAFIRMYKAIMDDENHPCHQRLRTLSMLYDFTPIQSIPKVDKSEH